MFIRQRMLMVGLFNTARVSSKVKRKEKALKKQIHL